MYIKPLSNIILQNTAKHQSDLNTKQNRNKNKQQFHKEIEPTTYRPLNNPSKSAVKTLYNIIQALEITQLETKYQINFIRFKMDHRSPICLIRTTAHVAIPVYLQDGIE